MAWKKESQEGADNFSVDGIRGKIPRRESVPRPRPRSEEAPTPVAEPAQENFIEAQPQQTEESTATEGNASHEAQEAASPAAPLPPASPRVAEIEEILSEGLEGLFFELSGPQQQEFKLEGERAARAIDKLLEGAKVKAGRVLKVIRAWLSLLPGVSRLFVEQEAKIKLDRILENRERK